MGHDDEGRDDTGQIWKALGVLSGARSGGPGQPIERSAPVAGEVQAEATSVFTAGGGFDGCRYVWVALGDGPIERRFPDVVSNLRVHAVLQ